MAINTAALIADLLGVEETIEFENREASDVNIANTVIAKQDPSRLALLVVNESAVQVNIRGGRSATTTSGIVLPANGDHVLYRYDTDFHMVTREFNAVAAADASAVYILEVCISGVQVSHIAGS